MFNPPRVDVAFKVLFDIRIIIQQFLLLEVPVSELGVTVSTVESSVSIACRGEGFSSNRTGAIRLYENHSLLGVKQKRSIDRQELERCA